MQAALSPVQVDPQVPIEDFDSRYAEIAAANFSVVLGNFGATKLSSVSAQLAASEKHGLKALVSPCEDNTPPFNSTRPGGTCVSIQSPALWGFQLWDEPSAAKFNIVADWSASIARRRPDLLRFVNLLPNYAPEGSLAGNASHQISYGTYVSRF
eukprot:COSAG06_NODE_34286_length_477_cov_0.613757_1_plen_153_part_10